jgi:hypothetical protein
MRRLSNVKVNSTEYASGIVIERQDWDGSWNIPAWEELGMSELVGPFESVEQAQTALDETINQYV